MRNSATHYLQRYPTTTARFRRVMMRKVDRSLAHHGDEGGERDRALELLDALTVQLTDGGWLDDARFVTARVQGLHRRGTSQRAIRAKLAQVGAPEPLVQAALAGLEGDPELAAALRLARRRRFGPFQSNEERRVERRDKDLAAMARAGFSYGVARRVLEADPDQVEELEELAALAP